MLQFTCIYTERTRKINKNRSTLENCFNILTSLALLKVILYIIYTHSIHILNTYLTLNDAVDFLGGDDR